MKLVELCAQCIWEEAAKISHYNRLASQSTNICDRERLTNLATTYASKCGLSLACLGLMTQVYTEEAMLKAFYVGAIAVSKADGRAITWEQSCKAYHDTLARLNM